METKICGKCQNEFPKNKKYFFVRKIKQLNAKGEIKIYNSFKSSCKECFCENSRKRHKKNYNKDIAKSRKKAKQKYWKDPESRRKACSKWYKKNKDRVKKYDAKNLTELTDSRIALLLKLPKDKIPKEIIETKRLIVKLKRELKNNNVKIK